MPTPFRFKQFSIDDSRCGMKVGMDAVLLGAWTNIKGANRILDIGTGTGIIALMMAQKSNAIIDAVEIDKDAFEQAEINISGSGWADRVKVYHAAIQNFSLLSSVKYDLIVTNPPYFINSFKAPIIKRQLARHNDRLSQEDIIQAVLKMLESKGRFSMILPYKEGSLFKTRAEENKLFCNKITCIKPNTNKIPNRLLMEFSFNNCILKENELIIEEGQRHQYTEAYKELTKDFYLAF